MTTLLGALLPCRYVPTPCTHSNSAEFASKDNKEGLACQKQHFDATDSLFWGATCSSVIRLRTVRQGRRLTVLGNISACQKISLQNQTHDFIPYLGPPSVISARPLHCTWCLQLCFFSSRTVSPFAGARLSMGGFQWSLFLKTRLAIALHRLEAVKSAQT